MKATSGRFGRMCAEHPGRRGLSSRSGFTLVEVMVAAAILGFLTLGIYFFTIDTSRLLFVSTEKLDINADARMATNSLSDEAREANEFFIYPEFNHGNLDEDDRCTEGESGDCLVLIFQEPLDRETRQPDFSGPNFITRILVFYHIPGLDGAPGPLMWFQIDYSLDSAPESGIEGNSPEELIAAYEGPHRVEISQARGLSSGRMFWMMNRESVMIMAEIFHGNQALRVTNTYNYTISPRG